MTISELICRLQAIKCEHGDLKVNFDDGGWSPARNVEARMLTNGVTETKEACIS